VYASRNAPFGRSRPRTHITDEWYIARVRCSLLIMLPMLVCVRHFVQWLTVLNKCYVTMGLTIVLIWSQNVQRRSLLDQVCLNCMSVSSKSAFVNAFVYPELTQCGWCSGVAVRRGLAINRSWVQFPPGQSCVTTLVKFRDVSKPMWSITSSITWYWSKDGDVLRLGRWLQDWRKVIAAYCRGMT